MKVLYNSREFFLFWSGFRFLPKRLHHPSLNLPKNLFTPEKRQHQDLSNPELTLSYNIHLDFHAIWI